MVTGRVREMQLTDPRKVRVQYEKGRAWSDVWRNNPRIAAQGEEGDFNVWCPRENGLRPYCIKKTPERWTWKPYKPPVGEFYFAAWETAFGNLHAGAVVVGPDIKGNASPNKQWGNDRWQRFAVMAAAKGVQLTQIGPQQRATLPGTRFVETPTIRHVAAIIARARAVVTHEGALHHVAAAVGTAAVVIYGGYISSEVTGYDGQVSLFTGGGLGCGMRVPCAHCDAAMAAITPEMVCEKLMGLLNGL